MRGLYEREERGQPVAAGADRRVQLFLQLAVLAFWTPCAGVDLYLLWIGRGREGAGAFVFWLLFRQALVFLALWFTVAISHGLIRGRRTPPEPRPRRRKAVELRTAEAAGVTLGRRSRGI